MKHFLLIVNGLLIAASYALGKFAAQHGLGPLGLLFWQVAISAAVLGVVALLTGQRPTWRPSFARYYLIAGVLGLTLPFLVTYTALEHLPTGVVGITTALSALMTDTMARRLRLERPSRARTAGLLFGLIGVLLIVLPQSALPSADASLWVLASLAAPLSLAAGNIYRSVAWPRDGRPLGLAAGMLATQAVIIAPIALATDSLYWPGVEPSLVNASLAGAGLLSSLFYLTSFELQRRAGPLFISQLGYVISLGSMVIGILVFGEQPSAWLWLSVLAILLGLALVTRSLRPLATPSTTPSTNPT